MVGDGAQIGPKKGQLILRRTNGAQSATAKDFGAPSWGEAEVQIISGYVHGGTVVEQCRSNCRTIIGHHWCAILMESNKWSGKN